MLSCESCITIHPDADQLMNNFEKHKLQSFQNLIPHYCYCLTSFGKTNEFPIVISMVLHYFITNSENDVSDDKKIQILFEILA